MKSLYLKPRFASTKTPSFPGFSENRIELKILPLLRLRRGAASVNPTLCGRTRPWPAQTPFTTRF